MVFSSLTFLFLYLPLTLLVYFLSPLRWRNFVLLVVSLLFYGWGEPVYIVIMFLSIIIDYTHVCWWRSSAATTKRPGGSWPVGDLQPGSAGLFQVLGLHRSQSVLDPGH